MAKNNNISDFMRGIADVLRAVKGDSALINPQDFENEICSAIVNTPSLQTITERATANGADIEDGVAFIKSIRGNSLKWMQMVEDGWSNVTFPYTDNGITFTKREDGAIILNGTSTGNARLNYYQNRNMSLKANHKYLCLGVKTSVSGFRYRWFGTSGVDTGSGAVFTPTSDNTNTGTIEVTTNGVTLTNAVCIPQLFDLTEMGMESITSADAFAQALGYSSASAMPALPYSATTIKHFNARKVVSKDADGEQIDTLDLASLDLWSAGSAYDEVDLAKGTKTKRIGKVKLKDLTWQWNTENSNFYANLPTYNYGRDHIQCVMCEEYATMQGIRNWVNVDKQIAGFINATRICVMDSSYNGDITTFKAHFTDEDYLYYELATPTTSSLDKAKAYFKVENGGKEMIANADGTLNTDSSPLKAEIGYKYNLEVSTTSEDGE